MKKEIIIKDFDLLLKKAPHPYKFVTIMGGIASGKTTMIPAVVESLEVFREKDSLIDQLIDESNPEFLVITSEDASEYAYDFNNLTQEKYRQCNLMNHLKISDETLIKNIISFIDSNKINYLIFDGFYPKDKSNLDPYLIYREFFNKLKAKMTNLKSKALPPIIVTTTINDKSNSSNRCSSELLRMSHLVINLNSEEKGMAEIIKGEPKIVGMKIPISTKKFSLT